MKLLSRKEELILLAIWTLQDAAGAYGVTIREYIERMTGIAWLFGAIYSPLARLLKNGLVEASESDPLPERGGRRKILYRLTEDGKTALGAMRELNASLWDDAPSLLEDRRP
jgi:PadR family transcriptional regulator PadR